MIPYHRAHHDLGDIAQRQSRIPISKEILDGIDNAVLHDPGHLSDVEVTGKHERLLRERALTKARAYPRLFGPEAKLRFQDPLHFDFARRFQTQRQFGAQPWLFPTHVLPETLYDSDFIGVDRIEHGQEQNRAKQHKPPNDQDASGHVGYWPIWYASWPQKTIVSSHSVPLYSRRF